MRVSAHRMAFACNTQSAPPDPPTLLSGSNQPSMSFQVADVDTGVINWINADLVTHIVPKV